MQHAARISPAPAATRDQRLIEGVIGNLALFSGLLPGQLAAIALQCSTVHARRCDVVANRDARLPGVFAVGYGTLKLSLRGADGEERVLRLVNAGETFGKATALLGKPCGYEARAVTEAKLVVIPTAAMTGMMERDSRFARHLALTLAERTLELIFELEAATLQRGAQRLASYLESLARPGGVTAPYTVRLPVSKTVVAARLGVKKETLSRLLRQFAANGLIEVAQRDVSILDRGRLIDVARANGITECAAAQ
jgi:CRP-like cAMP-binding protein